MKRICLVSLLLFLSLAPIVVLARVGLPVSSGDIRALFPFQSRTLSALERMESTFGESLFDAVIVKLPSTTVDDETVERLSAFRDDLGELPGVLSVFSPVEGLSRLGIPVRVITADRQFGRYLIEIDSSLNDQQRSTLDLLLKSTLRRYSEFDPIRAGAFSVSEEATSALAQESRVWTPACVAIVILITIVIFRDLRATVAVLFAPFVSILWLFAGLVLLDVKLLPVAQMVPPLLLGLGASYSVFIACRHYDARANHMLGRVRGTTASTVLACITTIAGFVALIPLDTRAVAQFGILMTVGTLMAGILSVWLVPLLLPVRESSVERAARSLRRLVVARVFGTRVLFAFALCSSILAVGARYLTIDTSPLDFLPIGSSGRLSIEAALQRFPGSHQLFVSLYRQEAFGELEVPTIQVFENSIRKISGVRGVTSMADFVELDERVKSHALVEEGGSLVEIRFGPSTVTSEDRKATRLFVETDDEGKALITLRDQIEELGVSLKSQGILLDVSSRELIMAEQSDALARGLLYSVVSALGLVGFLLFAIFRSIRIVIVGLLPSLLPIAAVFGGLGFISGQVNMGTAMVAAVALGMVSDNTFHYLIAWRARREQSPSEILELSSGSMIATALVLIGGFCPTILSALPPMNQFGLLLSVCVVLGLSANLFLLPGLVERFGRPKGEFLASRN